MPGRDVLARTWFEQARADLAAAEDSTATGHHEWACFQAQQAGGEGVKALLYARGRTNPVSRDRGRGAAPRVGLRFRKRAGLCLPGRSEKIREVVCRFGAHVPIRAVWLREGGRLGGSKAPGREGDPRDKRIEQQDREISRLRGELARTTRDRDRWKRRSERLKKQLDEARRAGRRQAAPFAKDRPQGRGRRPGRRAGARYGRQGCRPRPKQVDEAFAAPAPTACPDCGGAVEVTRVASQYQEELPEVRPLVRRFDMGAALLRRRPKGLLPAARPELLDPSKAWWGGRRGRLADRPRYFISVSLGVVPLVLPRRGSPITHRGRGWLRSTRSFGTASAPTKLATRRIRGGGLAHATVGRAAGRARNRSTRPSRRRRRRRVRTAAARLK